MNQKARAQVELIKKNEISHESREKHRELVLGLCKICHEENLADECPLLEYMMEDTDEAISDYMAESVKELAKKIKIRIMINKLKTNINTN